MRKGVGLVAICMILAVAPMAAMGQDFLKTGVGSLCAAPACGALEFSSGWVTNAGRTQVVAASLSPGDPWMGGFDADLTYSSYFSTIALSSPVGNWGTLRLSGSSTLATVGDGRVLSDFNNTGQLLWVASYAADTCWATLEGLLAFPAWYTVSAVGGFRWDYWQTSFRSPRDTNPALTVVYPWYLTSNSYMPFIGLVSKMGPLTFGTIGLPTLIGEIDIEDPTISAHGTVNSGYFLEIFADCSVPSIAVTDSIDTSMSLFCKYSALDGRSTMTFTDPTGVNPHEDFDVRLGRNLLFIGVKTGINFSLAGWW